MRVFATVFAAVLSFGLGWIVRGAVGAAPTPGEPAAAAAARSAPAAPGAPAATAPPAAEPAGRAAAGDVPGEPPLGVYVGADGRVVQPPKPDAPFVDVRSARYGYGDRWADVTGACKALVRGDTLTLPVNLHRPLGADPAPGFMKYVEMVVAVNGVDVHLTVADSLQLTTLRLSSPADAAAAAPPPDAAHPGGGPRP